MANLSKVHIKIQINIIMKVKIWKEDYFEGFSQITYGKNWQVYQTSIETSSRVSVPSSDQASWISLMVEVILP